MTAPVRHHLPNRRLHEGEDLVIDGMEFSARAGYSPGDNAAWELFLHAKKPGSMLDYILNDAAVVVSVAIQHGVPAKALAKSVARLRGEPASPVGAALDFLDRIMEDDASGD